MLRRIANAIWRHASARVIDQTLAYLLLLPVISRVLAKVRVLLAGRASCNLHALDLLLISSILDAEFATEVIKAIVCLALGVVID